MSVKLLVSDVDGTLVDKAKKLTDATIAAVGRLEEAGIGFTIVSARPRSGMMPIADALKLDEPMGAFNGGLVFRRDGTVESHETIAESVARGVMDLARKVKVDIWVFADDHWYASTDQGDHVDHERVASNQQPIVTDDFDKLLAKADKLTFVSDDEPLLRQLHANSKAYGDDATIVQSQTYYLDVTAKRGNKGDGIVALCKAFGVSLDDTAAIGDQANDVPMLERAGLSIAMGNAPDAVKAKAREHTTANDADGVAHAIDTIILPRNGATA